MFRRDTRPGAPVRESAGQTSAQVVVAAEKEKYFKQARAWNDDLASRNTQTIRRQRWALGGMGLMCMGLTGALLILLPLQRVEPYLIRVDSSTGIVDTVVSLTDAKTEYQEVETAYFVRKYVNLRENYSRHDIERNYRHLAVMTDSALRPALKTEFLFATPGSFYQRFGEKGSRTITIKNVSRIAQSVFQVRFFATERIAGIEQIFHYVSTVEYTYLGVPLKTSSREVTPLGFTVTAYRRVEEAVQATVRSAFQSARR